MNDYIKLGIENAKLAVEADKAQDLSNAAKFYEQSIHYLKLGLPCKFPTLWIRQFY